MQRICQQIESFPTFPSIKQDESVKWVLPPVGGPLCPRDFLGREWPPAPESPGPDQGSEDLEGLTEHREAYNKNTSSYESSVEVYHLKKSIIVLIIVTLDHITSHTGQFFDIEMYASSE